MTREMLPNRRSGWRIKARIEDQVFYLSFGEYPDGRLGEIFIDAHKEGTFARGVLGGLARMVSISLQNGVPVSEVVKTLRHLNFPPRGDVTFDNEPTKKCSSVLDWIAQEIDNAYGEKKGRVTPVAEASPPNLGTTPESLF